MAFLFVYLVSNAQNFLDSLEKPKWEIGIEGGPGYADVRTFDISTSKEYHTVSGLNNFSLGFAGQYNFNNYISVKTGINFERKGLEDDYGLPGTPNGLIKSMVYDTTKFTTLDYLVIPVIAKAEFTHNHLYFLINGGFYVGYLLNASGTLIDYDTSGNVYNHVYNPKKEYHKLDFGCVAGVGLGIILDKHLNLEIEEDYNQGLTNIASDSNVFPQLTNWSNIFSINLRYKIPD